MATIEIPAEFVGHFRLAVIGELKHDSEWVQQMAEELAKRELLRLADREKVEWPDPLGDIRGSTKALTELMAIAESAFADPSSEDELTIEGDASGLAYCCEKVMRVVVPHLLDNLPGPVEGQEGRTEALGVAELLSWAGKEAARLQGIAGEEVIGLRDAREQAGDRDDRPPLLAADKGGDS